MIQNEKVVKIEDGDTQKPESMMYLIRKRNFDKSNDQALGSLIDFCLYN